MKATTIKTANYEFACLEWGEIDQPCVVFLHGWLDNAASFQPIAEALPGYRLIAIDMAGHGKSSHRSPDAHYHLLDYVQDLQSIVNEQQWQPFYLVGHSLGGIVASIYAACFPEMVKKLVLIESFGPLTEPENTSASQLRKSILSRLPAQQTKAQKVTTLANAVIARRRAGDMTEQNALLLVQRNMQLDDAMQGVWRSDKRLRTISSLRMTESQAQALLSEIRCPVLAILGKDGFEKLKRNVTKRAAWIQNLKTVECPGGHHLHMDYPMQTAEQIQAFLNQSDA